MKQHGWFDAGKYWLRRVTATISTSGSGASLTVKLVGRAESIQEGVNIYGAEARWWGQAHILVCYLMFRIVAVGQRVHSQHYIDDH